jgi:alcohol dehydrogenase
MTNFFNFSLNTNVLAGVGSTRQLIGIFEDQNYERILVLADEAVAQKSHYFKEIEALLRESGRNLEVVMLRGSEEPDYDYLDLIVGGLRELEQPSVIIGIGGGSCLDITKAAAALLTNPGRGIEYRGFDKLLCPGIPTICIPTTAGTGSEVTINAVFTDKSEKKKLGINGRFMNATHAILDSEWTSSCPFDVALSSGMDALVHTLESFMCKQHNSMTRVYSVAAFKLLYDNLPALVDEPKNLERLQNILLGAHFAAIALFNSGSGISAALSYPIGVHFKVPHGIGGAIFIASVVEYNVDHGYQEFSILLDQVESHPEMSVSDKNTRFTNAIKELCEYLRVPTSLDSWGISADNVSEVAELMLPMQAAFDQNPIDFSAEEDVADLLRKHVKSR